MDVGNGYKYTSQVSAPKAVITFHSQNNPSCSSEKQVAPLHLTHAGDWLPCASAWLRISTPPPQLSQASLYGCSGSHSIFYLPTIVLDSCLILVLSPHLQEKEVTLGLELGLERSQWGHASLASRNEAWEWKKVHLTY